MINIKEGIKFGRKLFVLVGFLVIFFAINIQAMNLSQMRENKARLLALKKKSGKVKETKKAIIAEIVETLKLNEDKYFVHAVGMAEGEIISGRALRLSPVLQNLLGVEPGNREIPIENYSSGDIKILCDALKNLLDDKEKKADDGKKKIEEDMQKFRLKESVNLANMFTFFNVPDVTDIILKRIKIDIEDKQEDIDDLESLNPDLQKSLLVDPTIDYLKNIIRKAKDFKKPDAVINTERDIFSLAFSPDGKTIVVGCLNRLILWNVDEARFKILTDFNVNENSPLYQFLERNVPEAYKGLIESSIVAFSPDGQSIALGCYGNLILWDISNLERPTSRLLTDNAGLIRAIKFNHQGNTIAVGGFDKVTLWNIDTLQKQELYEQNMGIVLSLAFSSDGTKFVCGGVDKLVLWNIKDFSKINPRVVMESDKYNSSRGFSQVAFGPDSKKIVLCGSNEVILLDIDNDNDNKITSQVLLKYPGSATSLIFDNDGRTISLCYAHKIGGKSFSFFTGKYYGEEKRGFITLNMSNLGKITHQDLSIDYIHQNVSIERIFSENAAAISKDGDKIALSQNNQLNLFVLLTDEQKSLINAIKNAEQEKSFAQMRLLYELCLRSSKNQEIQPSRLCELEKRASELLLPSSVKKLFFKEDQPYNFCTIW